MLELLIGFVDELRAAGLPVSLTESIDAAEALAAMPLDDRAAVKAALGATLVKDHAHRPAFETVFEVYFSLGRGRRAGDTRVPEAVSAEELAEQVYQALARGDRAGVAVLAGLAVSLFAGMEPGRPVGGTYYLFRTMRQLDVEAMRARLAASAGAGAGGGARDGLSPLEERLTRDEHEDRLADLRRELEAEIRRRMVADRGPEAVARALRKPLPEDVDFMHATREELAAMRRAVYPLTRKLAVRLARKRRHGRRGALDFRSTVRHSLSYGGVPADPRFHHPRPAKPEIMVIADISGSVAAFARFTLQLLYAISTQFSRVRSFVFIDGVDEVTSYLEGADDVTDAIQRINTEADVIWMDGHSDYGHALTAWFERWGKEVSPKTSVILLGDARNNYHSSAAWVIGETRRQARHVFWLNPEPRSYWDTGDSIASEYAAHCDGAFECRNLGQLEEIIEQLV